MDKQETVESYASKKMAAGICGILLGGFGVHKFILGKTTPGLITIAITVFTCGTIGPIIGLIEGIIYLTKSDQDFYQTYYVQGKDWF
jgi:TM2 domain-containing membrane protein YozV